MSKLSSKLRKNENKTGITLSQIYLPKLDETNLKYYKSNSFIEIGIDFNSGLQVIFGISCKAF